MDIIIFGIGDIYRKNKKYIAKGDRITAFVDNNPQLQGGEIDGVRIYSPVDIDKISYDKIVIMSHYFSSMKKQLLELGCAREDIIYFLEYISYQQIGELCVYYGENTKFNKKRGLIITSSLNYHGGAIVAVYMALELQQKGYEMVIAAPEANKDFIIEFERKGIIFLVYPNLRFAKYKELFWTELFQTIIVNTYPMILCALAIGMRRKVIVWLHESDVVYRSMEFWKDLVLNYIQRSHLSLYAVSEVGKLNFERNVTKYNIGVLPYGIPDLKTEDIRVNENLRFAVIGTIHPVKCQLLFLDVVEQLNKLKYVNNEFAIIGEEGEDFNYVAKVKEKAKLFSNVKLKGRLTRKEIEQIYKEVDVLVISSVQETMSLIATEAMMYGKVCILCRQAGMAKFIKHGENGLLFQTGDAEGLAENIKFCIDNENSLLEMGKNARKTYEKYFTMRCFGKRLERILDAERGEI